MAFIYNTNGEAVKINNTTVLDERQLLGRYVFGERYYEKFGQWVTFSHLDESGLPILDLAEGWSAKKPKTSGSGEPKPERKPRKKAEPAPQPEQPTEQPIPTEQPAEPTSQPAPEPEPEPQQPTTEPAPEQPEQTTINKPATDNLAATIAAAVSDLIKPKGSGVDESLIRQIVADEVARLAEHKPAEIKAAQVATTGSADAHPLLDLVTTMVVNDTIIGRSPWLYGPAGSGKTTLAQQVAEKLGLPFYTVSSLQQKYELEGYADATGRLVEMVFYKAFTEGGIFLFDEFSTTSGEVSVAFNTALAQRVYNFPVVGMKSAHPDFHVIAADNTCGRGASTQYRSRFAQDESTLDRFSFVHVDYTDEQDNRMANYDDELVAFIKLMREKLQAARLTYLASPRSSKAIKALQATSMPDEQALWYGLCAGWAQRDINTLASALDDSDNKYAQMFVNFAK